MKSKRTRVLVLVFLGVVLICSALTAALYYSRSITSADDAVKRFYNGWIRENITPGEAFAADLHTKSTYTTEEFAQSVSKEAIVSDNGNLLYDPVLCGLQAEGEPGFNQVYERDGRARFIVQHVSPHGVINVYAVDDNGWRIDEVDCPEGSKPKTE